MQLTPVAKTILIINLVFFVIQYLAEGLTGSDWFTNMNALYAFGDPRLLPHQYITYMFLHSGFWHLFFNMWQLVIFGGAVEQTYGPKRFAIYYLLCGIGSALANQLCSYFGIIYPAAVIGASGALYGVMVAAAFNFPNVKMYIWPIIFFPIKLKWLVAGFALLDLSNGLKGGDNVAHFAHLGGLFVGLIILLWWRYSDKRRSHFSGNTYWTHASSTYDTYDKGDQSSFADKVKSAFGMGKEKKKADMHVVNGGSHTANYEYNQRRKQRNEEIDRILDKVRTGGFDNLTEDEKRTLFDASKR